MTTNVDFVELALDAEAYGAYLTGDVRSGPDQPDEPDDPEEPKPNPDVVFVVPA